MRLEDLLVRAVDQSPESIAIRAPDGEATYRELNRLVDDTAHALVERGVEPGDRIAFWLDKGLAAIATMYAALRCGAAYVPLDPKSPKARIERLLDSCEPRVLVTTSRRAASIERDAATCLLVDRGIPRKTIPFRPVGGADDDLAYILFTSGSTGTPKGVCISHRNALAFVAWAAETVGATAQDRFANHAPFHFDLSVFDIYASCLVGGCVCVVPDMLSFVPTRVVEFLRHERITVWYSVPSALTMMMQRGELLQDPSLEPRVVIFAGEPFPISSLAALRASWSKARMFNFYGPTETNVCAAYEVPQEIPSTPIPIGLPASGAELHVVAASGDDALPGEEGELHVIGPTVMLGYWGQARQEKRYATGDRVRCNAQGYLEYLGRLDSMLKIRGHRVEAGEVEAALRRHPAVVDAVVCTAGVGHSAQLMAFLVAKPDMERPSLLALKRICANDLPEYMLVDRVEWIDEMPLTGTGKRDRRQLEVRASGLASNSGLG